MADLNLGMEDLQIKHFNSNLIQDNKIVFYINEIGYRVRMPNQGEQALVEYKQNLAQLQFSSEEGCILKRDLIKKLKDNKVIDVVDCENQSEELIKEYRHLQIQLAQKDSKNVNGLTVALETLTKVEEKLQQIANDTSFALKPCLESRLERSRYETLTVLCTEVQNDGEWKVLWTDLNEFNACDIILTQTAIAKMTWLMLNKGI